MEMAQLISLGVQNTPGKKLGSKMGVAPFKVGCSQIHGSRSQRIFDFSKIEE